MKSHVKFIKCTKNTMNGYCENITIRVESRATQNEEKRGFNMSSGTGLPKNEKSPSAETADTTDSSWIGWFGTQTVVLVFGSGLFILLMNLVVLLGINAKPNAWLFHLNMNYWSVYTSVILWTIALGIISESTEIMEKYRAFIRMLAIISILLVIIFAWRNSLLASPAASEQPLLFNIVAIVVISCTVRSLFLFYDLRYGEDEIDMEEAQWFWGMSGFIYAILAVFGLMCMFHVKVQIHAGSDNFATASLFQICCDGLETLIQNGNGSFVLRIFALLLLTSSIAFIYVIGRWLLALYLKIRGE
jgi:hypothetical protein